MKMGTSSFSYHQDEEKTRAARAGELFTVGDIGYLDADGYLFLCDRGSDVIISAAERADDARRAFAALDAKAEAAAASRAWARRSPTSTASTRPRPRWKTPPATTRRRRPRRPGRRPGPPGGRPCRRGRPRRRGRRSPAARSGPVATRTTRRARSTRWSRWPSYQDQAGDRDRLRRDARRRGRGRPPRSDPGAARPTARPRRRGDPPRRPPAARRRPARRGREGRPAADNAALQRIVSDARACPGREVRPVDERDSRITTIDLGTSWQGTRVVGAH